MRLFYIICNHGSNTGTITFSHLKHFVMPTLEDSIPITTPATQQVNHYDPESAFIVYQAPYYRGRNTQVRHWTETRKTFGQRHVYQTLNPDTMQWLAPKPGQYFDIVVLMRNNEPLHPYCGHITAQGYIFKDLSNAEFFQLATLHAYTTFQRDRIMRELNSRGCYAPPPWKEEPQINFYLAKQFESNLPPELRNDKRMRDEAGFVKETFSQAKHREAKEREAKRAEGLIPAAIPRAKRMPEDTHTQQPVISLDDQAIIDDTRDPRAILNSIYVMANCPDGFNFGATLARINKLKGITDE